jgi:hypothetical protein
MRRRALLLASVAASIAAAAPAPPPLTRGINITNWFRFPARGDPGALRAYVSDGAIGDLAAAGFTHVRIPVTPEGCDAGLVAEAAQRLQSHGLATMIVPDSALWRLESSPADRAALLAFWGRMGSALSDAQPRLTLPEVVNEPVFAHDLPAWEALQLQALAQIRRSLPHSAAVLTGGLFGGVDGLLRLHPAPDRNVFYSIHFYEPAELTSLASYQPGLDSAGLSQLPFPVSDAAACRSAVATPDAKTRAVADFYCALHWDAPRVTARLDQVAAWSAANGRVLLGEFGASARLAPSARQAWLGTVRRAAEERGFGWTLWGYDDSMGFGIARPPPSRPSLDPAVLAALGLREP